MLLATDYKRVFAKARRSADGYFTILAAARLNPGPARLGLAIAKKQIRLAVRRNLLKRLARESFRARHDVLQGLDMVVMARAAASDATRAELAASLASHFDRLGNRPSPAND